MFAKKSNSKVDGNLAAIVRMNTVATLVDIPTDRLLEAAYEYGDKKDVFMLGCVAEAATVRLIDISREISDLNLARAMGERNQFGHRLGLVGLRTTCEYIQSFAQGRSDYLPPIF